MTAQIRKQFRNRFSSLGTGSNHLHARFRMLGQQAQQFHTGVSGTAYYSKLYHSNVYPQPLKWTQHYTYFDLNKF